MLYHSLPHPGLYKAQQLSQAIMPDIAAMAWSACQVGGACCAGAGTALFLRCDVIIPSVNAPPPPLALQHMLWPPMLHDEVGEQEQLTIQVGADAEGESSAVVVFPPC